MSFLSYADAWPRSPVNCKYSVPLFVDCSSCSLESVCLSSLVLSSLASIHERSSRCADTDSKAVGKTAAAVKSFLWISPCIAACRYITPFRASLTVLRELTKRLRRCTATYHPTIPRQASPRHSVTSRQSAVTKRIRTTRGTTAVQPVRSDNVYLTTAV